MMTQITTEARGGGVHETIYNAANRSTIRVIPAQANKWVSAGFLESLVKVYGSFGVGSIPASSDRVNGADGVHLVISESAEGEMLGGIRIHQRMPGEPLPFELALRSTPWRMAEQTISVGEGLAELSGLWVRPDQRKSGLSLRLVQYAAGMAPFLGITIGCAFAHQFSAPLFLSSGFYHDSIMRNISYPIPRYRSSVLWLQAGIDPRLPESASGGRGMGQRNQVTRSQEAREG